jgi:ABC-2 type transport system permease protein
MSTFVNDTVNVMNRELKPVWREPMAVVFAMIQPLVFLGLFAPLLPEMATGGSALQWFVPGIVAMTALMGASFTGSSLMEEMQSGSHERQLVSPIGRPALLVGRALKEVVPMLLQVAIIVAVVTPFSFDLHLDGVLVAAVLLSLFSVGVGALSFALALASKGQDWMFWTIQQTLLFPTLLTAGVLLPVDGAPRWLEVVSSLNPMTYVVDATRVLFAGTYPADVVAQGFAGAAVVAALGLVVGVRAMRVSKPRGWSALVSTRSLRSLLNRRLGCPAASGGWRCPAAQPAAGRAPLVEQGALAPVSKPRAWSALVSTRSLRSLLNRRRGAEAGRRTAGDVLDDTEDRDDGRGKDRRPARLVVEADVAAGDGDAELEAGVLETTAGLGELPHLVGVRAMRRSS